MFAWSLGLSKDIFNESGEYIGNDGETGPIGQGNKPSCFLDLAREFGSAGRSKFCFSPQCATADGKEIYSQQAVTCCCDLTTKGMKLYCCTELGKMQVNLMGLSLLW